MRIGILGAGESGLGAARLAHQKGYDVWISDNSPIKPKYLHEAQSLGIPTEAGIHSMDELKTCDFIIKSPGIPPESPIVLSLQDAGKTIISEIEFAYRHCPPESKIIGITGTNGKTTTSLLTYHLFQADDQDVGLCGNIGNSFARMLADEPVHEWYVVEISSFQLDDIVDFRPYIAILTNIWENHLDRYQYKLENYVRSKFRITHNQTADDYFIYCSDSPILMAHIANYPTQAQYMPFSYEAKPDSVAWIENRSMIFDMTKSPKKKNDKYAIGLDEMSLQGRHNHYNTMASGITGNIANLRKSRLKDALSEYTNADHRIEILESIREVSFINDSKATNVASVYFALDSVNAPIIWLAGGKDKGNDYGMLLSIAKEKVKALIVIGKHTEPFTTAFASIVPQMYYCDDMESAVEKAYGLAVAGDNILLSPACSSFDLYENYEARGDAFKSAVQALAVANAE
jgi:UDP-N-acetylmuramoylalanine--D-glutamate ligase